MKLDLRELIVSEGARLPFRQELDTGRLGFPGVEGYCGPITAEGEVRNSAGALGARGEINARMRCVCDRCGAPFEMDKRVSFDVPIIAGSEEDGDGEAYGLAGDALDLDDMLETEFILNMDNKLLCRPGCKGLCPKCGKNLNEGECGCRPDVDPRLAVLEQLLDK